LALVLPDILWLMWLFSHDNLATLVLMQIAVNHCTERKTQVEETASRWF